MISTDTVTNRSIMDENQRSHVVDCLSLALGALAKARDWLDDETGELGKMLNNHYADLSEALSSLRKETHNGG